jgi:hypothetical protein
MKLTPVAAASASVHPCIKRIWRRRRAISAVSSWLFEPMEMALFMF